MKNKITIIMILMSISFGYSQVLVPENTGYGYDNLTTVELNALTKKKVGDIYYNADLGYHVKWNGVIFESLASGISGIDPADQDKLNNISITQPVNLDTVESLANSALQTETDPTTTPANIKAKLESLTGTNRLDAFAIKNLSAQETDPNLTKSNVEGLGISYTSLSDIPAVSSPLTFGPGFTRTGDNIVLDNPFTTANETTLNSALQSETDPLYSAWDKDYNDLINRPVNLVTYDPLTAQDVEISVLGGSDSESYILEFDPNGYDYSGESSGTGTVDQTIIDGSTNAVSGNAVFDGLSSKLNLSGGTMTGELDLSLLMPSSVVSFIGSNTDPFSSGSFKDFNVSDGSTLIDYQFSPTSTALSIRTNTLVNQTAYTAKYTLPHTGTPVNDTDLITKVYADATYGASGSYEEGTFTLTNQDTDYSFISQNNTFVRFGDLVYYKVYITLNKTTNTSDVFFTLSSASTLPAHATQSVNNINPYFSDLLSTSGNLNANATALYFQHNGNVWYLKQSYAGNIGVNVSNIDSTSSGNFVISFSGTYLTD
ncbi:virion structural protein [Cellulophaga phage phi19:3]|uniref:Structural protein n=1 Tax=Cellulophaga phage phi19:3 TaxID=1327971 RepID=R9ZWK3_9CAUD|nr:virion structural protein [Cellulophaga phage phi19:3]AGO47491.1 structural protein [Cellulophaga phage phi19:3]